MNREASAEASELREEIAIIGMACRFPGARNVAEFWNNLCEGVESISSFTADELAASGIDPAVLQDPSYVNAGAPLEEVESFDAAFFGYNPREAELMDPQHRVFLECAWTALEDAGYDARRYEGAIGVYGGVARNTYYINNVCAHPDMLQAAGWHQVMLGSEKDFPVTRVSFKLGLTGPSISVQTACSTSGVAVHLACQSLLLSECDIALAGGARVQVPGRAGYFYEGGILSPDGHCRAFDARAEGTRIGSGVGIVVLKRLSDALRDRDHIHAIIKGTAINNDGAAKVGYTAPSVSGQAAAIAEAQALAEVSPDTISYVEAHGTGTQLGDPVEIAALTRAFRQRTDRTRFCAIGSVKTNIGHLDAGAGVAGIIKTALALEHKLLPPSLNFEQANPEIDFERSPFYVNTRLSEWKTGSSPRRAGVSSFGLGGTNAHIVLEEAPVPASSGPSRPSQLLLLSARTATVLDTATAQLAAHLKHNPSVNLADAAYTLQLGRKAFCHRRMVVCRQDDDAAHALEGMDPKRVITRHQTAVGPPVVFMFPGQGSQYVNMGVELYQSEPLFREQVDLCAAYLEPHLGLDLREVLYPCAERAEEAGQQLSQTAITQPALFVVEYALARMWMEWGVQPQAMIGHSVGEYVAACLAGVFSLEDTLMLLAARGRLIQQLPRGAMLAIRLSEPEVQPFLSEELSLAASNGPSLCVVSGPVSAVDALQHRLEGEGVACRALNTSHAFHSPMMEPVLGPFAELVSSVRRSPPQIPFVSNVTAAWASADSVTDPSYWAQHLRQTVRFAQSLQELLKQSPSVLLEVGPGTTLMTLARQQLGKGAAQVVCSSLGHSPVQEPDSSAVLNALGRVWLAGVEVDWEAFSRHEERRRIPLPTYPFERERYWIAPLKPADSGTPAGRSDTRPAAVQHASPLEVALPQEVGRHEDKTVSELQTEGVTTSGRKNRIVGMLAEIVHELSGVDLSELDPQESFLELGFDSLFLTRANLAFQKKFGVKITFRQLFEEAPNMNALAEYIDAKLPPDAYREEALPTPMAPAAIPAPPAPAPIQAAIPLGLADAVLATAAPLTGAYQAAPEPQPTGALERIMALQLQVMSEQLRALRPGGTVSEPAPPGAAGPPVPVAPSSSAPVTPQRSDDSGSTNGAAAAVSAPSSTVNATGFGPFRPIKKGPSSDLTSQQRQHLDALASRYNQRTKESKRLAQTHRPHQADPRTVAGFRGIWKEMIYPIVTVRSQGSRVWDVDGNEYVDVTMGFGSNIFGHSPPFVMEALEQQVRQGVELGGQSPLAGEVAKLICELTGMERMTFCQTGSEAILAALRAARTVTGRDRVALFAGSYHGRVDCVVVRPISVNGERRSVPQIPGIPQHMVEDTLVLDYGDFKSLDVIRAHADELAAVLVEPVQSRNPSLQPKEFLHALRDLTAQVDVPLIFDEIITGFRVHPGGAQAYFGIQADMATYAKAVGAGMPMAAMAGKAVYLDAFDGGMWQYGDTSFPQAGVTFLGGAFLRHPICLAASRAMLSYMKENGPRPQEELNARTTRFAEGLNQYFEQNGVPMRIHHFASLFMLKFDPTEEFSGLLFIHLRDRGVHVYEDYPCFLSTAHTDEDISLLSGAIKEAVEEMQAVGLLSRLPPSPSGGGKPIPDPSASRPADHSVPSSSPGGAPNGHSASATSPLSLAPQSHLRPTESQMEIWLASQLNPEASCSFNLCYQLQLNGPLNRPALQNAFEQLVNRHDALRITFSPFGDELHFLPLLDLTPPLLDLSSLSERAQEAQIAAILTHETETPFDLAQGPLLRTQIIQQGAEHHLLVLTVHHIICDGFSIRTLVGDLSAIYSAECQGTTARLPTPMQYSEYAAWQQEQQQTPEFAAADAYWLDRFSVPAPDLQLPTDRARQPVAAYQCGELSTRLDQHLISNLKRVGAQYGCTLWSVLLSGITLLLHRLTGQTDLVLGTPAAGQLVVGHDELIGHCVNLQPFRVQIDEQARFHDYLRYVQGLVLDAYDHRNYTYGSLLKKLKLPRDPSRPPLMSVQFNLEEEKRPPSFFGLEASITNARRSFYTLDIGFNLAMSDGQMELKCWFDAALFDDSTVERWLSHYRTLLESLITDPQLLVCELPLLAAAEREQLLVAWNDTRTDYARHLCLHQVVEAQVSRSPDAPALRFLDQQLSYQELNTRANQLARFLRQRGVGPQVLVGLCLERSPAMLVALLAVLKAGGAYVPLDPAYPPERLAFMLADAQAPLLVTQQSLLDQFPQPGLEVVCLDLEWPVIARAAGENLEGGATPADRAYVIYTSGSTGVPKGVEIPHQAVVNFLSSMNREPGLTAADRLLAVTTLSFDIAVLELLLPLVVGAEVVLVEREVASDGVRLAAAMERTGATVMQATPATWRMLVEGGWPGRVGLKILCGGEALSPELAAALVERGAAVWNLYGPTETTIWSTIWRVSAGTGPVSIGRPIANTEAYILDRHLQAVPVGVPGELYIGGDGLALGYRNRPEQTAAKFVPHPFSRASGSRLYKTGDLARYRWDGSIEYLGRIDGQVKIRGYRIELGEIETVLGQHPCIREAVVNAWEEEPGKKRLVAYLEMERGNSATVTDLRLYLQQRLPEYMVPATFVMLESLPLTPNGKIDRKALPAPDGQRPELERVFEASRTAEEKLLAEIWSEMLKIEQVGLHDDFFELGGDSLLIFRMCYRANQTGLKLDPRDVFQHRTIAELLGATRSSPAPQSDVTARLREQINQMSEAEVRQLLIEKKRLKQSQ